MLTESNSTLNNVFVDVKTNLRPTFKIYIVDITTVNMEEENVEICPITGCKDLLILSTFITSDGDIAIDLMDF